LDFVSPLSPAPVVEAVALVSLAGADAVVSGAVGVGAGADAALGWLASGVDAAGGVAVVPAAGEVVWA
jgi:hypothetical protein